MKVKMARFVQMCCELEPDPEGCLCKRVIFEDLWQCGIRINIITN